MDLTITNPSENFSTVRLKGKFTIECTQLFKEKTTPLIKDTKKAIFVDFTHVSFIDSSGIGVLILFSNSAKNLSINVVLYNLNPDILNLFKTAYLDKFFNISTSSKLKKMYPGISF